MITSVDFDSLWTVQDTADYLQVPVRTLYQWRTKKYGPAGIRVGRHLRYRRDVVEAWLDSVTTPVS